MREVLGNVPEFVLALLENPIQYLKTKRKQLFTQAELETLTKLVVKSQKDTPNFVELGENFNDVCIVGDLHGDLPSVLRIIKPFFEKKTESLVFLGDYTDRGDHSLFTFVLVLGLMLTWPDRVIALRGNHEDLGMNTHYGFEEELWMYYKSHKKANKILQLMDTIYDYLSLAVLTPQGSICLHGGIPEDLCHVEDLNQIPKPHSSLVHIPDKQLRNKLYRIFTQIRWNDPLECQKQHFGVSDRGPNSLTFNENAVADFLEANEAKRVIRAHESTRGGFQTLFNGKLLHVFSSEPYFGNVPTAYVIHEQKDNQTVVRDLKFNIVKRIT